MAKVSISTQPPEFTSKNVHGNTVSLSDFANKKKCAACIQSRICLTLLPQAYGAVASGL